MTAARGLGYVGIAAVYAYRYTLGLLFPASCKYHPSCSQYAIDALRRYGLARGSVLAAWRLLRCNPWSLGGVDYAEEQTVFPLFKRGSSPPPSLTRSERQ